jgi:hypothetical protein
MHLRGALPILCMVILLSGCDDWPYYVPSIPGGRTELFTGFPRANIGDRAHLPISTGELTAHTNCYPREGNGYQHCTIILQLIAPPTSKISFSDDRFMARSLDMTGEWYGVKVHRCRHDSDCFIRPVRPVQESVTLHLNYDMPPGRFEVFVPAVIVDGTSHVVPSILFRFEDAWPYRFSPPFVNY